jgi:hypothetical protein
VCRLEYAELIEAMEQACGPAIVVHFTSRLPSTRSLPCHLRNFTLTQLTSRSIAYNRSYRRTYIKRTLQEEADASLYKRIDEIAALYDKRKENQNQDKLELCITKAFALLAHYWLSRQVRLKTLIILGATLPSHNWDEADMCHMDAERLWGIERQEHPERQDEE